MNSSKKAQIEINFNWIFVIIAGAAILFFFIKVIGAETNLAESASQTKAVSRMNTIITALQQNPDSINKNHQINYEIYFECTIEGQSYGIKNSDKRESLSHHLVYTPEILGNSKLTAWVKTFNAPYPIAPIVYLTDENTKYVFLKDRDNDNTVQNLYNQFPQNISKELATLSSFQAKKDEGYRQYIVIINERLTVENFGLDDYQDLASKIKNFIVITGDEVKFYELDNDLNFLTLKESKEYITNENIIGAIIAGQPDLYECVMNKALDQMKIITDMNLNRIQKIRNAYGVDYSCYDRYSTNILQNYFVKLSNAIQDKDYDEIKNNINNIESANNQLIFAGCAQIY